MKLSIEQKRAVLQQHLYTGTEPWQADDRVLVFGAGNTAFLYQNCFRREGIDPVAYCDNQYAGQERFGKITLSPAQLKQYNVPTVLLCSTQPKVIQEMKAQLAEQGLCAHTVDEYIFTRHREEVLAVFDLLSDGRSKEIYADLILARMGVDGYADSIHRCPNQYFCLPAFARPSTQEVFVDCGAFVGDSVERYIWSHCGVFQKIIAFEPDAGNFRAMQARIARLNVEWNLPDGRIEPVFACVSDMSQDIWLKRDDGAGSLGVKISQFGEGVRQASVCLDEYLKDQKVDFLKADVESYEYNMLCGARQVITNNRPLLAISIYHNALDMIDIPLLISSMSPRYSLAVRHHSDDYAETVLYAWET